MFWSFAGWVVERCGGSGHIAFLEPRRRYSRCSCSSPSPSGTFTLEMRMRARSQLRPRPSTSRLTNRTRRHPRITPRHPADGICAICATTHLTGFGASGRCPGAPIPVNYRPSNNALVRGNSRRPRCLELRSRGPPQAGHQSLRRTLYRTFGRATTGRNASGCGVFHVTVSLP